MSSKGKDNTGCGDCTDCDNFGECSASETSVRDSVKEYYGKRLQKTEDLKSNACCTSGRPPQHILNALKLIHGEVAGRYYGCGLVVPNVLEGKRILDLGSGSGRDCFILSKLVGENGFVMGVDMTKEQVEVATKYIPFHTEKFGYKTPNIEFKLGYIERLHELGIKDNTFDIIISNCVVNLSPDKEAVLREAFRILKPGGEVYFSDVYSDRRIPQEVINGPDHEVLWGECLSGALYWGDFMTLAKKVGFIDPRLVEDAPITIGNDKIAKLLGDIRFVSATYRLFKIPTLDAFCEDYGQAVIYKGTIPEAPSEFVLDHAHSIPRGKVFLVCRNTYQMLKETRFAPHFEFIGDGKTHFGIFEGCGTSVPFSSLKTTPKSSPSGSKCC